MTEDDAESMVSVDITAPGSWGATAKSSPAVCAVHTLSHREEGGPTGWRDGPREGTAHKSVSTQQSQPTHPALVAGEAALWEEGSGGPRGQQQQRQQQAELPEITLRTTIQNYSRMTTDTPGNTENSAPSASVKRCYQPT